MTKDTPNYENLINSLRLIGLEKRSAYEKIFAALDPFFKATNYTFLKTEHAEKLRIVAHKDQEDYYKIFIKELISLGYKVQEVSEEDTLNQLGEDEEEGKYFNILYQIKNHNLDLVASKEILTQNNALNIYLLELFFNHKNYQLPQADFIGLLKYCGNSEKAQKETRYFVEHFLKNNDNISLGDFTNLLQEVSEYKIVSQYLSIIKAIPNFLNKKEYNFSLEEFKEFLTSPKSIPYAKFELVKEFIIKNYNKFSQDNINTFLDQVDLFEIDKNYIKIFCGIKNFSKEEFCNKLKSYNNTNKETDLEDKIGFIELFLKEAKNKSLDDFIYILQNSNLEDSFYIKKAIIAFLENDQYKISETDFCIILQHSGLVDANKASLIKSFLTNQSPEIDRVALLIKILKDNSLYFLRMQVGEVVKLYKEITNPKGTEEDVSSLLVFAKSIYNSFQLLQVEVLKNAINKKLIGVANIKSEKLKEFIHQLEDNDNAIDLATHLASLAINSDEKSFILHLVHDVFGSEYKFIHNIVGDKTISECLTPSGIDFISREFGDQSLEISFMDIVTYHDLFGLSNPSELEIQPELKLDLQGKLKSFAPNFLVHPKRITKISQLLGVDEDKVKVGLLEVKDLFQYFTNKFPTPTFSEEDKANYKINKSGDIFGDTDEIETQFKKLLLNNQPTKDDVVNFCKIIAGNSENFVNQENQNKIFDIFCKSKQDIANLFSQENGVADFVFYFQSLNDGCSANMGNNFYLSLYKSLLKNRTNDAILFDVVDNDIIRNIINESGGDIIDSEMHPLKNKKIGAHYISLDFLFDKIYDKILIKLPKGGSDYNKKLLFNDIFPTKEGCKNSNDDLFSKIDVITDKSDASLIVLDKIITYFILRTTLGKDIARQCIENKELENFIEIINEFDEILDKNKSPSRTPSPQLSTTIVESPLQHSPS